MTKATFTKKNRTAEVSTERFRGRWVTTVTLSRTSVRHATFTRRTTIRVFPRRADGLQVAKEFVQ